MSVYGNLTRDNLIQIMNEAYIGKNENFLEMEKLLGLIRSNLDYKKDLNRSENVQKFNRLMEKQFGCKVFALRIEKANVINAYTEVLNLRFDITNKIDMRKAVIANQSDGYRFKEPNNFCIVCTVYSGLLAYEELSNAELLAIILHEIGHNFADGIYGFINIQNSLSMAWYKRLLLLQCILILPIPHSIKEFITRTNKYKLKQNKQGKERKIKSAIEGNKAKRKDKKSFKSTIKRILSWQNVDEEKYQEQIDNYKNTAEGKKAKEEVRNSAERRNEVIADKFPAVYGYGNEIASGLLKMDMYESDAVKYVDDKYGKKIYDKILKFTFEWEDFDEHPRTIQRINEVIKTLEDELTNDNLDPKFEKEIKDQINRLKKTIEEVSKAAENADNREKMRAIYYAMTAEDCPDAVNEDIEKAIIDAFNNKLKEGENK